MKWGYLFWFPRDTWTHAHFESSTIKSIRVLRTVYRRGSRIRTHVLNIQKQSIWKTRLSLRPCSHPTYILLTSKNHCALNASIFVKLGPGTWIVHATSACFHVGERCPNSWLTTVLHLCVALLSDVSCIAHAFYFCEDWKNVSSKRRDWEKEGDCCVWN